MYGVHQEILNYMNTDVEYDICQLIWWKANENKYKTIASLAQTYINTQATSVA